VVGEAPLAQSINRRYGINPLRMTGAPGGSSPARWQRKRILVDLCPCIARCTMALAALRQRKGLVVASGARRCLSSLALSTRLDASAAAVTAAAGSFKPDIAMILGSGLGCLAEEIEPVAGRVCYNDIPHMATSAVEGHVRTKQRSCSTALPAAAAGRRRRCCRLCVGYGHLQHRPYA
jgi:hypothetical protein